LVILNASSNPVIPAICDELLAGGATDKSYVTSVPDVDPTVILVGLPSSSLTTTGALKIFLYTFAWFPVYVKKFVQSTIVFLIVIYHLLA